MKELCTLLSRHQIIQTKSYFNQMLIVTVMLDEKLIICDALSCTSYCLSGPLLFNKVFHTNIAPEAKW